MYQRPITPVVLGIPALELLFELRKGFTPENRRFPIGASWRLSLMPAAQSTRVSPDSCGREFRGAGARV